MAGDDRMHSEYADSGPAPATYALSAVVYVERGDEILLLQRAVGSALAGQWFPPGGMVEPEELPEVGARRELLEEAGLEIDGELELVGCYPMHVYGYDTLQLSYRGTVSENGSVVISHEHDGARWVKAADMRALLSDDVLDDIAAGDNGILVLLRHIRTDLDRYLARTSDAAVGREQPDRP